MLCALTVCALSQVPRVEPETGSFWSAWPRRLAAQAGAAAQTSACDFRTQTVNARCWSAIATVSQEKRLPMVTWRCTLTFQLSGCSIRFCSSVPPWRGPAEQQSRHGGGSRPKVRHFRVRHGASTYLAPRIAMSTWQHSLHMPACKWPCM